jgi:geranylgeranyl diphosphate synthase type I
MTLMVVNALSKASSDDKDELVSILKAEDKDTDVKRALEIFEKYDSINYAHDIALQNVDTAKKLLKTLDESDATVALSMIADYVLQRNH